jgi:hypothetical protein
MQLRSKACTYKKRIFHIEDVLGYHHQSLLTTLEWLIDSIFSFHRFLHLLYHNLVDIWAWSIKYFYLLQSESI